VFSSAGNQEDVHISNPGNEDNVAGRLLLLWRQLELRFIAFMD
jgi:hypothetical protein